MVGDSGIKLSGGQRQRLAIARSIVKRPKILILDEATSSIDVRGEQMVQAALDKVSRNRTTVVIAHRLATVRKADNIIVLRKGKAIQQGTHDTLMTHEGGAYWALATAQQLSMESEEESEEDIKNAEVAEKKSMATIATDTTLVETVADTVGDSGKKPETRGFWAGFALLLREQRYQKMWYTILLLSALGGGGMFSVIILRSRRSAKLTSCVFSQPADPGIPVRN